jgi:hypothetical protein
MPKWWEDPVGAVGDLGSSAGKLVENVGSGVSDLVKNPVGAVKAGLNDKGTLTGLAALGGAAYFGGVPEMLGGAGAGGADLALADAQAGLLPQYGSTAAYDAGITSAAGSAAGAGAQVLPEATAADFYTGQAVDGTAAAGAPGASAPAAAAAAAPGAATPSLVQQALSAMKQGVPIASLAMAMKGQSAAQKSTQQMAANAQQQSEVSNQLLANYRAGQLSASDQQGIVQWKQSQRAAVDQYYQKAGLSNSSMHQQAIQQIDSQAETMRQQAVQNMLSAGMSAAGVSNAATAQAANAALQNDKYAGDTMQAFLKVLGEMNTPQKAAPTGTPSP